MMVQAKQFSMVFPAVSQDSSHCLHLCHPPCVPFAAVGLESWNHAMLWVGGTL